MKQTRDIRKISVGVDYKNAMHYIVGQNILDNGGVIHLIRVNPDELSFEIWVDNGNEIVLWKEITKDVPCIIEYNVNF